MPFCTQCGSGVSAERCSNCGAENPHFRDVESEGEVVGGDALAPDAPVTRPRPWPLLERSLALSWPRLRKYPIWFAVLVAVGLLSDAYGMPFLTAIAKAPTDPAKLLQFYGHLYLHLGLLTLVSGVVQGTFWILGAGEAMRERTENFAWSSARVVRLIAWYLLYVIVLCAVMIAATLVTMIPVMLLVMHAGGKAAASSPSVLGLITLALMLGLLPLMLWISTKCTLFPAAYLLEGNANPLRASWTLTTGYFWETLGLQLLYIFIGMGIGIVAFGISGLLAVLNPALRLVGYALALGFQAWLTFAIAEGFIAWTIALRAVKEGVSQPVDKR